MRQSPLCLTQRGALFGLFCLPMRRSTAMPWRNNHRNIDLVEVTSCSLRSSRALFSQLSAPNPGYLIRSSAFQSATAFPLAVNNAEETGTFRIAQTLTSITRTNGSSIDDLAEPCFRKSASRTQLITRACLPFRPQGHRICPDGHLTPFDFWLYEGNARHGAAMTAYAQDKLREPNKKNPAALSATGKNFAAFIFAG